MAVNHLPFVLLVVVTLLATTAAGSRQGGREKDSTSDKARRMRSKMERLMEKERKIGEDNRARILAEREVVDKEEEEEALSRMWQAVLRLEERCAVSEVEVNKRSRVVCQICPPPLIIGSLIIHIRMYVR